MDTQLGAQLGSVYFDVLSAAFFCDRTSYRPSRIIRNKDNLIVFWEDGTKTVVKPHNEGYDPEKGLGMALARKLWGRADTLRYIDSIENQNERSAQ